MSEIPDFGDRLRLVMQLRNKSQRAVERESGLSQGHMTRLLRKDAARDVTTVHAIARALNVDFEWLATGDGSMEGDVESPPDESDIESPLDEGDLDAETEHDRVLRAIEERFPDDPYPNRRLARMTPEWQAAPPDVQHRLSLSFFDRGDLPTVQAWLDYLYGETRRLRGGPQEPEGEDYLARFPDEAVWDPDAPPPPLPPKAPKPEPELPPAPPEPKKLPAKKTKARR